MDSVQQSALRKTAWRLVPLLTIAYIFNYLDRTCIGFAALTMNRDIGLSNAQFGIGAGVFFIGYCVFEIPSNLAMYRFGARRWLARIMISWGLVSALTAFVVGPNSFYGVRMLLGVAEAGFFPGVTYFLAAWFPAQYRTRMLAWFLLGIPASSLIGSPVCGLLLQMDGIFGLQGWKWLFLVVSLPCVVLGIVILFMLADRPQAASWLTQPERDAMDEMLRSEVRERPKSSLLAAIADPRVLILAAVQFGFTLGSYGIGIWLPLIVKEHQLSNLTIGFVTAVPYLFASLGMMAWAYHVDRTGKKIFHLTITCLLGAVGLGASVMSGELLPALIGLTLALIGVTAARAVFWTIPTRFLTGVAAAGGLAFINMIGTFGGFVGPAMMGELRDLTGSFESGLLGMGAIMVAATLLSASLKLLVAQE
ncbi:MFS transporter [Acidisphaera sp. L21]|jgi:ACS family tartrate transporter-like MFS transporter|uniref:MFS transporter n=1 Tax=Acidisphaera sp. L21 TaxID=1641851 RepID=UPI00131B0C44|nr:MFS transporter [Acidisphaera sp. L21]